MDEADKPRNSDKSQFGLRCPSCSGATFRVIYTRARKGGKLVRRRECLNCHERLTTWERPIGNRESA